MAKSIRIVGVMTGTSCDGLDAACMEFGSKIWRPLWSKSAPYPTPLRKRVLKIQEPGTRISLRDYLVLNRDLGAWYAVTLAKMLDRKPSVDAVANHGQTVAHFPGDRVTLQMGDSSWITSILGVTTISQFRVGDLAAGGEGAPLAPLFHRMLARQLNRKRGIAIHNLGGISNLTYLSARGEVIAFDTGPANAWIDAATEKATRGESKFDRDGKLGAKGHPDEWCVQKILKNPYFLRKPPKSTGRDDFPIEAFMRATRAKGADLVATATAITVESIARAYEEYILDAGHDIEAILLTGGGSRNRTIVNGLRSRLPDIEILKMEDLGFDSQFIEAQAFAYFGFRALLGLPLGGTWTGVKGFGSPGQITPGQNWRGLLAKVAQLRQE